MVTEDLVLIDNLCLHYKIELSFIDALDNIGLIKIEIFEQNKFICQDKISERQDQNLLQRLRHFDRKGVDR